MKGTDVPKDTERKNYLLKLEITVGMDYGGSQNREDTKTVFEEIDPEQALFDNGRFSGVIIRGVSREYNGFHLETKSVEQILRVSDIGTPKASVKYGEYFGNDDHERWNYTKYTLIRREDAENTQ